MPFESKLKTCCRKMLDDWEGADVRVDALVETSRLLVPRDIVQQFFDIVDANNDGSVTVEEFRAHVDTCVDFLCDQGVAQMIYGLFTPGGI